MTATTNKSIYNKGAKMIKIIEPQTTAEVYKEKKKKIHEILQDSRDIAVTLDTISGLAEKAIAFGAISSFAGALMAVFNFFGGEPKPVDTPVIQGILLGTGLLTTIAGCIAGKIYGDKWNVLYNIYKAEGLEDSLIIDDVIFARGNTVFMTYEKVRTVDTDNACIAYRDGKVTVESNSLDVIHQIPISQIVVEEGIVKGNVMDFSYFDRWIESLEDKASRIAEKTKMYTAKKTEVLER